MEALKNGCYVCGASVVMVTALLLASCSPSPSASESATAEGNVPIAYVKRPAATAGNPTDSITFSPGGDLYLRELSSPSAPESNLTGSYTQGQGDVSDPEVSYDGKKILFSMRGPRDRRWAVWEYDTSNKSMHKISCDATDNNGVAVDGDDVDPAYLADDRIVFSSNRQEGTRRQMQASGSQVYTYLDEYEREPVITLHTMDADGKNCKQISFNQSHDRNPTVLADGTVMFARWDHVGGRNHFAIFKVKPDGTDLFVKYGAHNPGNSFLHPREMQDGRVMSTLMPLSRTQEGGALMIIDISNYSEHDTPAKPGLPATGGQQQATAETINFGQGISTNGRVTTPYPLWDGTQRALLAYTPCQVRFQGVIVSCSDPRVANDLGRLGDRNRLQAQIASDPIQDNAPATYGIYMFDVRAQTLRLVVPAATGYIYTDPVALLARTRPNVFSSQTRTGSTGILEVRSVYDTDDRGRMGPGTRGSLLMASELSRIPVMAPVDSNDTRPRVANIGLIKDPAESAYLNRVARYVRITKSVPPPSGSQGLREAIGETEFEMQQILGYADVEPDGSIKLQLPSDTPLTISVLDDKGRAIQTHVNWIQVRPNENRACNGCHSPRRGEAINSGALLGNHPHTQLAAQAGETMAATRTRVDSSALSLKPDIAFRDVWADTAQAGVVATPCVSLRYSGNTNCATGAADGANDLATPAPTNGIINYPQHIQPLWDRPRTGPGGVNYMCTACHNDPQKLDLTNRTSGMGRLVSYDELLIGDPLLDTNNQPVTRVVDGVVEIQRGPALVNNMASQEDAGGIARKSRLTEIIFGETLQAGADARLRFPGPSAGPDHATLLNNAEKRLLVEWMDLGGQYYNSPFDASGTVRMVSGLSQTVFDSQIHPILMSTCAQCHQPAGSDPSALPSFQGNRYVLTGSAEGDFNVTLSMVNDACVPENSLLLSRPSAPHPTTAASPTVVLPVSADPVSPYALIRQWILGGCI